MSSKNKLLVIVGPTASGKSDLAVVLAKKYNGEIVSADSRQIYKGLDIGSGKVTTEEMGGIKHYMLDVISPNENFSVSQYKEMAEKALSEIFGKNKLPIICGGTGFYIDALVDNKTFPEVPPNAKLRAELELKKANELFEILKQLDFARAENIDSKNKRRLVRSIEIAEALGKVPPQTGNSKYEPLIIGIKIDEKRLKEKIAIRLEKRIKEGLIEEVKKLNTSGITWERLESFGLEYKYVAMYIQHKITETEMKERLLNEIWHYAKRQMTWWKKDKRIHWIESNNEKELKNIIDTFLV